MRRHPAMERFGAAAGFCWLALGALLAACSHDGAPDAATPLRAVQVAPAQELPLEDSLHAVGLLTPKDEMRLSFKVGGVIESVEVEEGQAVRAGQVLAALKQAEIDAALEQARQATLKARRDLARGKALLADGVTPEEAVQDLTTKFEVAAAAQAGAEFNARHSRIVAAANGVVLRKMAEANEVVQAGQTVVVLGSDARGWVVRVGLADRDVVRTRVGDAARVEFDAWPGQGFPVKVGNIASAADPATGTFTVEIQVDPRGARFAQGLVAKVVLAMTSAGTVQFIPVTALVEANDKEAGVFPFDPATRVVRRITLEIGGLRDGRIEVLGGLPQGAQVVTAGAAYLANGETVRVAER